MTTKLQKKIIASSLIGNLLEWFDFSVYGYLSSTIALKFFPADNFISALFLTYGVFATGFLMRPLGAVIIGHIGDVYGRKKALLVSIFTMSIPTFLIGCLPTYEQIGITSSLMLLICRLLQGFSIGGEFSGSFIYLVEQAPVDKKGVNSCWADIGCIGGMLLGSLTAAFLNSILTPEEFLNFGWRLPFLCGILLALIGVYIRNSLPESKEFLKIERKIKFPLKHSIIKSPAKFIAATFIVTINAFASYTILVYLPNQAVIIGKFSAAKIYFVNTILLSILMLSVYFSAKASDYFDKFKIYMIGCVGVAILSYPAFYAFTNFSLWLFLLFIIPVVIFLGMCFGPRPTIITSAFAPEVRYSSVAIAYNITNAIFGGGAPFASAYIVEKTANAEAPSIIIIVTATISLIALIILRRLTTKTP